MSFFQELKRRNVFRVGIAYVIVAWLLLQVADTLGPALLLPEWFQSGVVFVLILGFPLVLVFAWAFELTPEGLKREKDVDRSRSITPKTGQKLNLTIIALLGLAVVYLGLDKFVFEHEHPDAAGSGAPSIAVLPFANMSDDASNEFFADGITEELLNLLAKIPELQVTSRTSAFQFKGKEIDIPTVAKQLNVAHVLEGSVRKSGTKVRITAQLIDADTDRHVWSDTYDRELDDIFAIQDEIARKVVDVLHVTLLGQAPTTQKTDADAYTLYLEGLHFMDLDGPDFWPQAQAKFDQALEIDPGYAPAWFGKAEAIRELANWGDYDLAEGTELARQWARHALELDPTLAEAWALLAQIELTYDWDWAATADLVDKALQYGPRSPRALAEAARLNQVLGRLDEARSYFDAALAVDPLSNTRLRDAGVVAFWLQDYARADSLFRKIEALYPEGAWPNDRIAVAIMEGRYGDAERLVEAILEWPGYSDSVREYVFRFSSAYALPFVGRRAEAEAALEWLISERGAALSYQYAEIYATHGKPDKAFEWLETGFEYRDGGLTYLLVDPWLEPLHDDPRWRPLLEKMKLLDYWDAMQEKQRTKPAAPGAPA